MFHRVDGTNFLHDVWMGSVSKNKVVSYRVNKLSQTFLSCPLSFVVHTSKGEISLKFENVIARRAIFSLSCESYLNTWVRQRWDVDRTRRDRFMQTEKKASIKECNLQAIAAKSTERDTFWKLLSQTRESTVVVQARLDISWGTRSSRLYSCLKLYSGLFLIPFCSPFLPDSRSCLFIRPTTLIFSKTYLNLVSLFHFSTRSFITLFWTRFFGKSDRNW